MGCEPDEIFALRMELFANRNAGGRGASQAGGTDSDGHDELITVAQTLILAPIHKTKASIAIKSFLNNSFGATADQHNRRRLQRLMRRNLIQRGCDSFSITDRTVRRISVVKDDDLRRRRKQIQSAASNRQHAQENEKNSGFHRNNSRVYPKKAFQ